LLEKEISSRLNLIIGKGSRHLERRDYAGVMAIVDTVAEEYRAVTEDCGLLDRSDRGKLALTGSEAKEFLAGQVSNDIVALVPGEGCYATFLSAKGRMQGDVRVLDAGQPEGELLLDTERATLQALFDVIRKHTIGFDAQLHKRTVQSGLLSLLGPRARQVAGVPDLPAREHAHAPASIAGRDVRVIATDAGVDVLCAAEDTEAVRDALLQAGATPVSQDAAETLRVEHGRPRWGHELDESVIPQEAGLNDRAVSFTKGCYVGQETVARLHWKGKPNRHLRGLRLSAPAPAGTPLLLGDREVGVLGTSVVSPEHGPIALALVRREAAPGDAVTVGDGDVTATVCELPFRRERPAAQL
jgi:folate-binding protein YgfZ